MLLFYPGADSFWTVYAYVIAYRSETIPIQIVAVVHGARQLEAFFQQRIQ
jgi:plasmid stabilization system protein ParE